MTTGDQLLVRLIGLLGVGRPLAISNKFTLGVVSILCWIVFSYVWRKLIAHVRRRKLTLKLRRDRASTEKTSWFKTNKLLQYFELDPEVCGRFYGDGLAFESLGEYMASLQSDAAMSIESILISVMDRFGPSIALPLALFAPTSWKKEIQLKDVKEVVPYPETMLTTILSTKSFGTVTELIRQLGMNAFESQVASERLVDHGIVEKKEEEEKQEKKYSSVDLFVIGTNPKNDGGLAERMRGDRFLLDWKPVHGLVEELVAMQSLPTGPKEIHSAFPGLYFGNGGLKQVYSLEDSCENAVMSCVCNRLCANALVGSTLLPGKVPQSVFVVRYINDKKEEMVLDSLEDLVSALEESGHEVELMLVSNVTSMGVGMSVLCDDDEQPYYSQIPLAYPLATGMMYRMDGSHRHKEAVTLMTHGALFLKVRGPVVNFHVEWCLNVTGTTAWQPVRGVGRPWQQDPNASVKHATDVLETQEGRYQALSLVTVVSAVTNVAADVNHVVMGGYGYFGVCLDSVAAVQKVLTGTCTLYPLLLGGAAKQTLVDTYNMLMENIENTTQKTWKYRNEAMRLKKAVAELPCDMLVQPEDVCATATRALQSLPEESIFVSMKRCKEHLRLAMKLNMMSKN